MIEEQSTDVIAIKPSRQKKKKKEKKEEEERNSGFMAWLKYTVGLTGGIKYVNKYLQANYQFIYEKYGFIILKKN